MKLYAVWNLASGFVKSPGQYIAFRLLAGLAGSAPFSVRPLSMIATMSLLIYFDFATHIIKQVGGGGVGDLFDADKRGRAVAIYSLAPFLEPVIGPILGAWYCHSKDSIQDKLLISTLRIAQRSTWRWAVRHFYTIPWRLCISATSVLVNEHSRFVHHNHRSALPSRK